MTPYDRVLTGRPASLPGDPWSRHAQPRVTGNLIPAQQDQAGAPDPAAVAAQLAEAQREAAESGYASGRASAERELGAAIATVNALAHTLETAVPRDVDMVARTVAELAVLITRRILGAELHRDPSVLIAAIEAGIRQAVGASVIHVELNPSALDAVEAAWTTRHGLRHRGITWSFAADPTLPAGGCRLRTEHGIVDAGFEAQLSEIAGALDAAIPGYLAAALGPTADQARGAVEPGPDGELLAAADLAILDSSAADLAAAGPDGTGLDGMGATGVLA
jgi:flagellar assembly protein FliH